MTFKGLHNRSIQSRIMSLLIITSLTLILALGLVFYNNTVSRVKESKQREMTTLALETTNKIERFLFERSADIKVLASSHILGADHIDLDIQRHYLENVVKAYQTYDEIFLLDASGQMVITTNPMTGIETAQIYKDNYLSDTSYVSDFIEGDGLYVFFSEPIVESGVYKGIVVEKMNFKAIADIIDNVKVGAKGYAKLTELSPNNPLEDYIGVNEVYSEEDNGMILRASYPLMSYPSQSNQWIITVSQPLNEAYGVIRDIEKYFVIVILIFVVIMVFFSRIISQSVSRPIRQLQQNIGQIMNDQMHYTSDIVTSDEIKHLTSTFDFLLEELNFMMQKVLEKSGEVAYIEDIKSAMNHFIEQLPKGIITIDGKGEIISMNPAASEIIQINLVGENIFKSAPLAVEALFSALKESMHNETEILDLKMSNHLNQRIVLNILKQKDINDVVIGMTVVIQTFEERQKFEESLIRTKRLSELGVLSAGVAHEIRNPLASIKGYAQLVLSELDDSTQAKADLETVLVEVERLDKIIDRFMTFASPNQPELEASDLNKLMEDVLHLMSKRIDRQKIRVERNLTLTESVFIDYDQIKQVILNIVINALQAMPSGGVLKVTTARLALGEGIEISISDTGEGIADEIIEKVFTPFFTTRSEGTGLGLSICSRIIESHSGRLEIQSEEGVGTQIVIKLPLYRKESM